MRSSWYPRLGPDLGSHDPQVMARHHLHHGFLRLFETSNGTVMRWYIYIYIHININMYAFINLCTLSLILVEPWLVFAALVLTVVGQAKTGKSRPSKLQHFIPHWFDAKELLWLLFQVVNSTKMLLSFQFHLQVFLFRWIVLASQIASFRRSAGCEKGWRVGTAAAKLTSWQFLGSKQSRCIVDLRMAQSLKRAWNWPGCHGGSFWGVYGSIS